MNMKFHVAFFGALCVAAVPIPAQSQADIDHLWNPLDHYGGFIRAQYVSDPSSLWEGFDSYQELRLYRRAQRLANRDAKCSAPVGGSSIARVQRELEYARCRYKNAIETGAGNLHKRRQSVVIAQERLFAARRRSRSNAPEGAYVNGKKHGRWIEQQANGDVLEGSYVNGK